MDLTNLNNIQELIKKHNLSIKKFFGQNFLTSKTALKNIIAAANIQKKEHLIEIGPGLGTLTKALTEHSSYVTCLELDHTLLPVLQETAPKANIILQDALKFTPPQTSYKIVANIPYYITSPLITHFLQADNPPQSLTLLIQQEVAEKIITKTPKMTFLSLQIALFANTQIIAKVSKNSFFPIPKVNSAIIQITPHHKITPQNANKIIKIAKTAFSKGRKKLSNTLPEHLDKLTKLDLQDKRPQHLTLEDWQNLTK